MAVPFSRRLRAISIACARQPPRRDAKLPTLDLVGELLALGEFGVRVFFVISGFLITGLLLDELAPTDRIRLGHFYFRRTLRIFPPTTR